MSANNTSNSYSAPDLYRRLLRYVKPYWPAFIVTIAGMLVFASTETGLAALMKPLMDGSFVNKDPHTIKMLPIWLIGIFLIRGMANFLTTYGLGWIARNVIRQLRTEMFDKFLHLPTRFFDHNNSGQLMSKVLFDVEQVATAASDSILIIIRDTLTIIGLLAWMAYLSWTLSLIILVTVPFIALIVYVISNRFRRISKRIQNSMGDVSHISSEVIEGHREIKTFGGQYYEQQRFAKVNNTNRNQRMKKIATDASSQPVIQFVTVLGFSTVIYFATQPHMLNELTVGTFISFMTAMFMVLTPLKRLTKVNSSLQSGIAAAESVFELLDQDIELDTGTQTIKRVRGDIKYKNVSFSYDAAKNNVLENISFQAKPEQTIALVGHSGSGKTTLAGLLARFYNIEQGQILIDDININQLTLKSLREQLSLVSQQVVLFNDTIANNIAYGQQDKVNEAKIIEAAKAAYAWEFIQKLPEGLQTEVGENGVLLSGGQRQRLAIARALLRDAPILILDEATSALDTESERHIQAALENLMKQRTTFVIAHRLSTIENADLIIVMHDGKIVESGTHGELLSHQGHYADLHKLQFQEQPN